MSNAMIDADCIVWDFDGVLNANMRDGRFIWADRVNADIGHGVEDFLASVFTSGFDRVITGQEDLLDRIRTWTDAAGFQPGAEYFLNYWFENDALPDPVTIAMMDQLQAAGYRQVIATNNEARRSAYIENEMGFSARIEKLYSSGRMGLAKPDPAFFAHVEADLGLPAHRLVMIDDKAANVETAMSRGWQGHVFAENGHDALRTYLGLA